MTKKTKTIDLSKTNYTVSELDLIIGQLKRDSLHRPNLLFRGFNGQRLETILTTGTDNPKSDLTFCATESDFNDEMGESPNENPIVHASLQPIPALAVYDGSQLEEVPGVSYQYRFRNPSRRLDALVTVYLLKC
jgi:hypothetical protein